MIATKLFKPNDRDIAPILELTHNTANCNLLFGDDLQKNNCIRNVISRMDSFSSDEALTTLSYLCENGNFLACLNTISYQRFQNVFNDYNPTKLNLDYIINRCDGVSNDEFINLSYFNNKKLYCTMVEYIAKKINDKILFALAIQNMCLERKQECISTSNLNIHFSLIDNYKFYLDYCSTGKEVSIPYCNILKKTQVIQNSFKETFVNIHYGNEKLTKFNKLCLENISICRELFSEPQWINRILDSKTFPTNLKYDKAFYDNYPLSYESAHFIVRQIKAPSSRPLKNNALKKLSNLFEGNAKKNREDCNDVNSQDKKYCFLSFDFISDISSGNKDLDKYCSAGDEVSCEYKLIIKNHDFLQLNNNEHIINVHQTLGSKILENLKDASFYKNRLRMKKDLPILLFYSFCIMLFSSLVLVIIFIKHERITSYLKSEKIKKLMNDAKNLLKK